MKEPKMLTGPMGTIISEIGSGYVDHALLWDDADRGFLVVTHAPDLENNNLTFAELYVAEDGDHYVHRETKRTALKNDTVKMTNRKANLVISLTGHGTGVFPRPTSVEDWVIPDIWQTAAPAPVPTPEPPITCVPPLNRPHFRPNRNVTRAQLAKIQVLGSDIPHPPTTAQTFEDVPVGSTFHEYIEALYGKGAISGYQCEP